MIRFWLIPAIISAQMMSLPYDLPSEAITHLKGIIKSELLQEIMGNARYKCIIILVPNRQNTNKELIIVIIS